MRNNRREWMVGVATTAFCGAVQTGAATAAFKSPLQANPLPLTDVRLRPSHYATAVESNIKFLLSLSPDRLLHNYRKYARLKPKAPIYGGWESDTIAGHTLGHYMSALVLAWQQTGNGECRRRANYIVDEIALCQSKRKNGYVGALGRRTKNGRIVDAQEVFEEIGRGEIEPQPFNVNGSWVPLYTVHKTLAGLLDVHGAWDNATALEVAIMLGRYVAQVFDALTDEQMRKLLSCEFGGLNESYAELYARTSDQRWLTIAERICDRKLFDPLVARKDRLAYMHANTQIAKVVGFARIHELSGKNTPRDAARFFWERVTQHHSYVIGGNAEREYFFEPDTTARHLMDSTCEHCNTYNMLKLTRHLYSWAPNGALFDYYERAHLNHVMAAHNPETAGFAYYMPMRTGAARRYSSPSEEAFWCCVGTGMESHAKHGDSIFWEGEDTLFVNLYIPSTAQWQTKGVALILETEYPFKSEIKLTLAAVEFDRFAVALRIPGWANGRADIRVNGEALPSKPVNGYAVINRSWKKGDVVCLNLPLDLRFETAGGSQDVVTAMYGPLVLAADLGSADMEWSGVEPVFVGKEGSRAFEPVVSDRLLFRAQRGTRPADLTFVPFFSQYERRSAVYFKCCDEADWKP
ncbi:beta-L-arabinofuranosidase domain-containing protein [Bradyrhizobium sp. DASA03076]|uniref:glycoside hydrolase family 127 protein n=1 Tax=Bradyrhizobium sp. BLXBL-03 TaxID=3395916 RepID=UPI003F6E8AD7